MSDFSVDFEKRLYHWALWVISINTGDEGWPNKTLLHQFKEYGFISHDKKTNHSTILIGNVLAQEVNTLVMQLRQESRDKADALYDKLISNKRPSILARERQISLRKFQRLVLDAKKFIFERLYEIH